MGSIARNVKHTNDPESGWVPWKREIIYGASGFYYNADEICFFCIEYNPDANEEQATNWNCAVRNSFGRVSEFSEGYVVSVINPDDPYTFLSQHYFNYSDYGSREEALKSAIYGIIALKKQLTLF